MSDLDRALVRMLYLMIVGLMAFGMAVAVGHVEEKTSYGLPEILHTIELLAAGILGILAGKNMSKTEK